MQTPAPMRTRDCNTPNEEGASPIWASFGYFLGEVRSAPVRQARQTRGRNTSRRYYAVLMYTVPRRLPVLYIRKPLVAKLDRGYAKPGE